jgi:hypothetical protein
MKKLISFSLVLVLFSVIFAGCKKDKGDPPVLPPYESMIIDFTNFVGGTKGAAQDFSVKGTNTSNWEFAAERAVVWKLLIDLTLAVPVASFKVAVDQTPVYLDKNSWQWSYNVSNLGVTYKARLTGLIGATNVTWKMYIKREGTTGAFPEFIWFEGTSKLDGTGGQWILNESAATPAPFLQIDWTKSGTSIGKITYTSVKNLSTLKGSYIEYGLTTPLNAYYTINYFDTALPDVNVEWNTSDKSGKVKCFAYVGDNNWYCWNGLKLNIICP